MDGPYGTIVLLLCIQVSTQLYHEPSMQTFSYNLPDDSYFGYSLTYQPYLKSLMIGAPKADKIGQIFTITINTTTVGQRAKLIPVKTPPQLQKAADEAKGNVSFMFGASVQVGSSVNVMCAPRYVQHEVHNGIDVSVTLGLCFRLPHVSSVRVLKNSNVPSSDDDIENKMRTYGWGLGVARTGIVTVGAPAMGAGRAQVYQHVLASTPPQQLMTPNATKFNFGYSVAFGNFFDNERITSLYYAISTPYGSTGSGKVYFFDHDTKSQLPPIEDDRVGTMFGATLCTVNLEKRRDSLLVGAPAYADDFQVDRGAVYLYVPERPREPFKIIKGRSDGAYFGSAIANLGDLDGDKKEEVAISAPYEDDGRGAVYIYSGAGLLDPRQQADQMLIQRIQPEPKTNLRAFGFSLTALQSFVDTVCNDLAVGAPHSNKVVLFKCFPSITVKVQAVFPTNIVRKKNEKDELYFTFQSCINVEFPEKLGEIQTSIDIKVQVVHPYARLNTNSNETSLKYKVPLKREQTEYCRDVEVLTPKDGTYDDMLLYYIKGTQEEDVQNATQFHNNRVLLSKNSRLTVDGVQSIAYRKEGESEPNPILTIEINLETISPYVVGSTTNTSFWFTVHNDGDVVYTPCIYVQVNGSRVLSPPQGCVYEGADLICTTNFGLRNGSDWNTGFITLDTTELTSKDQDIDIAYAVFPNCNTRSNASGNYTLEKILLVNDIRGLIVKGHSDPSDVIEIYTESSQAHHMFTITNNGVTKWIDLSFELVLTKNQRVKYYDNTFKAIGERLVLCQKGTETNDTTVFTCNHIDLKPNDIIKLSVPFEVLPEENNNGGTTIYNVTSNFTLILNNYYSSYDNILSSIVTSLQYKQTQVPLWIIVTACLGGLLIIMIIIIILYKMGWLRRKKKDELKNLKKSFRESMRMQSMRASKPENTNEQPQQESHSNKNDNDVVST
ncbi:integrin alpha-PS5-like [Epargyreus clarus]|uniref:integrin alpha-PS5-like n=1 Tax=Epargyreus clarus TaxID=520877 RepID=UPI003C2CB097